MALKTTTEQLQEVQACITALLAGGQDVQLDGQRLKVADLAALSQREEILRDRLTREQRAASGMRISVGVQRR